MGDSISSVHTAIRLEDRGIVVRFFASPERPGWLYFGFALSLGRLFLDFEHLYSGERGVDKVNVLSMQTS
jgi:hypothetical protein